GTSAHHDIVIQRWTGAEAKRLRVALRLSIEGFAERLGVSSRTVSKWEARGETLTPRPDTQAMLDTLLSWADAGELVRFVRGLTGTEAGAADSPPPWALPTIGAIPEFDRGRAPWLVGGGPWPDGVNQPRVTRRLAARWGQATTRTATDGVPPVLAGVIERIEHLSSA
ncbi:MAG: helix-turn-helix domain-containing protein, partial [Phycicoccus sp.]